MRYEKYDAKADLWSVGAIAYEMVFGSPPYRADNHIHLLKMIEASNDSDLPFPVSLTVKQSMRRASSAPSKFSKEKQSIATINIETSDIFRDLLLKLLRKDPAKRINFGDLFAHPFVSETFSRPPRVAISHSRKESIEVVHSHFGSPLAESKRAQSHLYSQSQSTNLTSILSTIEEILRLDEENLVILELFENIDRKPPVRTKLKTIQLIILILNYSYLLL